MKSHLTFFASISIITLVALPASAALVTRLGGLAVYDTDRNITWLADANAGAGSTFDDGADDTDGRMTWLQANAWAASLTIGGFSDWRLPTTIQPDPSCTSQPGSISEGGNCTGSEMGHLYYDELSGDYLPIGAPANGILASGDQDLMLFSNIQSLQGVGGIYHSATEFNTANIWFFNFNGGQQGRDLKTFEYYAWAVRDGDVSLIPIPAAAWLLGSGLLGLIGITRAK